MYGSADGFKGWAIQQGLGDGKDEQSEIEVISCNWETVAWFMACANQWDRHPQTGQMIRLRCTEIEAAGNLLRIKKKKWRENFTGLIEMINEVLKVKSKK